MQKNESLSTKNVAHRITKRWVAEDEWNEIADIEVSVTTLRGFQEINTGELLKNIAEGFRAFYLEVGNALNAEQVSGTGDANKNPAPEAGTLGPGAEVDLSGKGFSSLECKEDVGMKLILKGTEEEIAGLLSDVAGEIAALVLAAQERQSVDPIENLAGKIHDELKRRLEESRVRREPQ